VKGLVIVAPYDITEWVNANIVNDTGKFNPRASRLDWWKGKELILQSIYDLTEFLDEEVSLSVRFYCVINAITEHPVCKVCNNHVKFSRQRKEFSDYCSNKCIGKDPDVIERKNQTSIDNNGYVANFSSKQHKGKTKLTCLEKHGDENYNNPDKNKETCLEKYGKESFTQTDQYNKQVKETCLERYDNEHWMKTDEYREMFSVDNWRYSGWREKKDEITQDYIENKMSISEVGEKYCISKSHIYKIIRYFGLPTNLPQNKTEKAQCYVSLAENEVADYIATIYSGTIERSKRNLIWPQEVDIFLPDLNIAIEYNGTYWHSDLFKGRTYHKNKKQKLRDIGVNLISIYEFWWKDEIKQKIVKEKLQHIIGGTDERIYARKTTLKEISYKEISEFCDEFHIQGSRKTSLNYGLFDDNNELVSVMGLSKYKGGTEIVRYATSKSVVGGFSKMLSRCTGEIYSYLLLDFSSYTSNVYEKTGFLLIKETPPSFHYIKNGVVLSRLQTMKHKLCKVLDKFDDSISAHDNMTNEGWLRVWNCGSLQYKLIKD